MIRELQNIQQKKKTYSFVRLLLVQESQGNIGFCYTNTSDLLSAPPNQHVLAYILNRA